MFIRHRLGKFAALASVAVAIAAGGNLFAQTLTDIGLSAPTPAYNWKPVQIHGGGIVTGFALHPAEPGLMYCRTDVGGSYRWSPTNDTWTPLLDFLGYLDNEASLNSSKSIGLDAQDPNRLYLSCGSLGGSAPSQIITSTDRGATFTRIKSPFVIRGNTTTNGVKSSGTPGSATDDKQIYSARLSNI